MTAKSQRNRFKVEAVAFYDAISGLPPDAPAPGNDGEERGKHYRRCYKYATVAWECFKSGTRPAWAIGRNTIFKRYEERLAEVGMTYLRAVTAQTAPPATAPNPKKSQRTSKRAEPTLLPRQPLQSEAEAANEERGMVEGWLKAPREDALAEMLDLSADDLDDLASRFPRLKPLVDELRGAGGDETANDQPASPAQTGRPHFSLVVPAKRERLHDTADPAWVAFEAEFKEWIKNDCVGPQPIQPVPKYIEVEIDSEPSTGETTE